jgi:hypothetical protein
MTCTILPRRKILILQSDENSIWREATVARRDKALASHKKIMYLRCLLRVVNFLPNLISKLQWVAKISFYI